MTDVALDPTQRGHWTSDQEVRWCPGCGDYGILAAMQFLHTELAEADPDSVKRENTVFISGIGCAARFPYYMSTYGMHSIHGRSPAIATGLAIARPDLDIWVVGGDGDMLSIGGNHLIHALRRNVNLTILLFNNQIYGLTKGQYSPTSEIGKITKSTPMGSIDAPFNPLSLAAGAGATFIARTHDLDRKHMIETFRRAHEHRGASIVEIYQNCNVFNDGAFDAITKRSNRSAKMIDLVDGQPIRFGEDNELGVVIDADGARVGCGGRGRRVRHRGAQRGTPQPLGGVCAFPTGQRSTVADTVRRAPCGRSPRIRRRCHRTAARGQRAQGGR